MGTQTIAHNSVARSIAGDIIYPPAATLRGATLRYVAATLRINWLWCTVATVATSVASLVGDTLCLLR
jgi:hypothetical protein